MTTTWKESFGSLEELAYIVLAVLHEMDAIKRGVHSQAALKKALALRLGKQKPEESQETINDHAANIVAHIHSQWSKQAGLGEKAKDARDPAPILFQPPWLATFTAEWCRRPGSGNKWDIFRRPRGTVLPPALFINGVFETTLAEAEKIQKSFPGMPCYLQPYASERIKLLAENIPTPAKPVTLYLSLTDSLQYVSYRARIIGWQDKRELAHDKAALAKLNQHIKDYQPSESDIYLTVDEGKPCVNLISIIDVERLESPVPVSCFIKTSDGKPLGKRTRSGGWSPVHEQFEWLGTSTQAVKDDIEASFQDDVEKSLRDSASARQQRLAKANKLPESIQVISRAFRRNADVVAEVLMRADGTCEECHSPAPFLRATDSSPYLEVHHRKLLSAGGEDTVANAVALCPNCHRKLHFGKGSTQTKT
jgi:5-methylcytosine-specific restriction endonuclease McrA